MTSSTLLTLNAGSSSIKFALFENAADLTEIARGQVERIGADAAIHVARSGATASSRPVDAADHDGALRAILDVTSQLLGARTVAGVGHRITHGGPDFAAPRRLDQATLTKLEGYCAWAPLHQPFNLAAVNGARAAFPKAVQIGCFDTAFHRGHDIVADAYALPRRYYEAGVRRYGFHGLSYQYIAARLAQVAPDVASGRVIVAHLGNGASMCAMRDGKSIQSTMGFTALDGLAMGTRCGQIDPGVLLYLLEEEGLDAATLADLLYRRSGLLGLSGKSSDMRVLLADPSAPARDAVAYFVHRARLEIGALAAALGGLDALVFCGGIGENAPEVRARICGGLQFLDITLDGDANAANAGRISRGGLPVLIVATNEERVIAQAVFEGLAEADPSR